MHVTNRGKSQISEESDFEVPLLEVKGRCPGEELTCLTVEESESSATGRNGKFQEWRVLTVFSGS